MHRSVAALGIASTPMERSMKRMLPIAILVGSLVGLAHGFAISEGSQGRYNREDADAIRQVIVDMTTSFNRHDTNTSLFARDADFVDVRGRWLKGAAEIEEGRKSTI